MKPTIGIFFGGKSPEHEVSLRSAKNVVEALDKNLFNFQLIGISQQGSWYSFPNETIFTKVERLTDGKIPQDGVPVSLICEEGTPRLISLKTLEKTTLQCAFPVMHGPMGEDGSIQGLFKMMNLPFVGCGIIGSAAGMDKEIMKRLLKDAHIPNAKYLLLTPSMIHSYEEIVRQLGSPFFIKPANAGSSVGVHKIKTKEDFAVKLKDSFSFDSKVLAEEFIQGREIECSVMGHNHHPQASLPGEVVAQHEFYSYEAKYLDDNGAKIIIPAELTEDIVFKIQEMAMKTYQVMCCDGLTRVDFFLKNDGSIYINEINTIPGFTKISMYPKMWEASGLSYKELITKLIEFGLEKFKEESKLSSSYL